MADVKLDPGFEEVELDKGFEEVPVEAPAEESTAMDTAKDFGLGAAQGLTLGSADELTAAGRAAYDVATSDKTLADLQDLYKRYQANEQARYKAAQEASPTAFTVGQVTGGLAPGIGAAGLATRAIRPATMLGRVLASGFTGAGAGAVEGLASSEDAIIGASDAERARALDDAMSGAKMGAALGAGFEGVAAGVKKGAEALGATADVLKKESPIVRQATKAFKAGEEGQSLLSQSAKEASFLEDQRVAQELADQMVGGSKKLGGEVGATLDEAAAKGLTVQADEALGGTLDNINRLLDANEVLRLDPKSQRVRAYLQKISRGELNPEEARDLVAKMRELGSEADNPAFRRVLDDAAGKLREQLGAQVPGYNEAAQAFSQFSAAAPEALAGKTVSGTRPEDFAQAVQDQLLKFVKRVSHPGAAAQTDVTEFLNFTQGLKKLQAEAPEIYAKAGIPPAEVIEQTIRDRGDMSSIIRQIHRVNPEGLRQSGGITNLLNTGVMGGANVAGQAVKKGKDILSAVVPQAAKTPAKAALDLGKNLYQAGEDQLTQVAQKLAGNPKLADKAAALSEAVATKNQGKRNAVLFTILQDPEARALLNTEE